MQGEIVIGTKLDRSQLEEDLKKEERELQRFQKEAEKLSTRKIKYDIDMKKAYKELERLDKEIERQKGIMAEREAKGGSATKGAAYIIAQEMIAQYEKQRADTLEEIEIKYDHVNDRIKENEHNQKAANERILEYKKMLQDTKSDEIIEENAHMIANNIRDIGKNLKSTVKRVTTWAVALIGVRSAISFITKSMSTLSQYDEGMAQDISYINYLLATTLKPIVETLISLAYKLLAYIRYIAQAWFGIDILANASTEEFKKQNQQAKQLKNTLSGFDEMNVIQDSGSTQGAGVSIPELPDIENIAIPDWVQWIADNGDEIARIIASITGAVLALKLGLGGMMSLGIGLAIYGILEFIKDIQALLDDPSWENFIKVIADIGIAIGGLMLITGNWWGLLVSLIALLVKLIIENWDSISAFLGTIGAWIYDHIIKPIADFFAALWDGIVTSVKTAFDIVKGIVTGVADFIKNAFETVKTVIKNIFNGIKNIIKNVFNTIKTIIVTPINWIIDALNTVIGGLNKISVKVPNWVPHYGGKKFGFNIKKVPKIQLAQGTILNNPGKGVPVGYNAVAGEAGREAYLPLSNTQLLEELGSTIGKYITINANINNNMNGRLISRELQKLQNESNFAYDR